MNEKKCSERNNSGYLMQFSQKKCFAEFNSHLSESLYRGLLSKITDLRNSKIKIGNRQSSLLNLMILFSIDKLK